MGIFDKLTGSQHRAVGERVVIVLTPLGKTKAEKFDLPGRKWQVLATLDEQGASTITEIAEETRMSTGKVKSIVKELIATGYAKKAGEG